MVPTLLADSALEECLRCLNAQTFRGFEVIVVDNSGRGLARELAVRHGAAFIQNPGNAGFGAAVNQGIAASNAPYVAALNDDAAPQPGWLAALVDAMRERPDAGMCASQVRLAGKGVLDSAGMLIAVDGSSKQRGHGCPPDAFSRREEVLLPSACAAVYRRSMLDEAGGFDEDFFLYSEDTDLGLRARRAGWNCMYAAGAIVEHRYSHSAGSASPLKAYYVERNRLFLIVKNFPLGALAQAFLAAPVRYFWHAAATARGAGTSGRFRGEGNHACLLPWYVLRAHLAAAVRLPALWRKRRAIWRMARLSSPAFMALLRRHSISLREVAAL